MDSILISQILHSTPYLFEDIPVSTTIPYGKSLLTNIGRINFITKYFKNTDLYIGLWSKTTTEPAVTTTLVELSTTYEIVAVDNLYYSRQLISKNKWIIDPIEIVAYLNSPIKYAAINTWANVTGYFIATTEDSSGKLLAVEKFTTEGYPINIFSEQHLTIYPKIRIF